MEFFPNIPLGTGFAVSGGLGIDSNSNSLSGFEDRGLLAMQAPIAPPPQMADLARKVQTAKSDLAHRVMLFSMLS